MIALPFEVQADLERADAVELTRLSRGSRNLVYLAQLPTIALVLLVNGQTSSIRALVGIACGIAVVASYVVSPRVLGTRLWNRMGPDAKHRKYVFGRELIEAGVRPPFPFKHVHHYRRSRRMIVLFYDQHERERFALPVRGFPSPDSLAWLEAQLDDLCWEGPPPWWTRFDPVTWRLVAGWALIFVLIALIEHVK